MMMPASRCGLGSLLCSSLLVLNYFFRFLFARSSSSICLLCSLSRDISHYYWQNMPSYKKVEFTVRFAVIGWPKLRLVSFTACRSILCSNEFSIQYIIEYIIINKSVNHSASYTNRDCKHMLNGPQIHYHSTIDCFEYVFGTLFFPINRVYYNLCYIYKMASFFQLCSTHKLV